MISKIRKYRVSNRVLLWAILLAQLVLVFITYRNMIRHPHEHLFASHFDGVKNYYTFQYYIDQPWQKDPFQFIGMNYPFGDNILFTDNMQLVSVPLKLLSEAVPGLGRHALPIYNYLMLFGFLASSYLLVRILSLLLHNQILIGVMALVLPWINPQTLRLWVGHMNLSLSLVMLAGIYFLLRLFLAHYRQLPKRRWEVAFILMVVLGSFLHMYYLVLLLAFASFFYLFWVAYAWHHKEPYLPLVWSGMRMLAIPPVVTLGIIQLIDRYKHLRSAGASGYDWIEWKLNFSALFTPYSYKQIPFLFETTQGIPYESYAYLGAFALFGLLLFLGLYFFGNRHTYSAPPLNTELPGRFLALLGLAAIGNLFIALGDYYYIFDGAYRFTNYLNVFFYLGKVTKMVTQFRCLGRFVWIFFWAFQFVVLFLLDRSLQKNQAVWLRALVALLLLLTLFDLKDSIRFFRDHYAENILTHEKYLGEMRNLLKDVDTTPYQAVLTIPYFHVGTEGEYNYTIDPDDPVSNASMQLSIITGLPLMASKLSRTPPEFGPLQYSIFTTPAPELLQRLDNRPILVLYNKAYHDGRNTFYDKIDRETSREILRNGATLPERYQMPKLNEHNDWVLYQWQLKSGSGTETPAPGAGN